MAGGRKMSGKNRAVGDLDLVVGPARFRIGSEQKGGPCGGIGGPTPPPNVSKVEVRVDRSGRVILENEACLIEYEIGKIEFVRSPRNWRYHPSNTCESLEWRNEGTNYHLRFPTLQEREKVWGAIQNHLRFRAITGWIELHLSNVSVVMDGVIKSGNVEKTALATGDQARAVSQQEEDEDVPFQGGCAVAVPFQGGCPASLNLDEEGEVYVEDRKVDFGAVPFQGECATSRSIGNVISGGRNAFGNQNKVWDPGKTCPRD